MQLIERFHEGQKVVCIKDDFPNIATTLQDKSNIGTMPSNRPVEGETLVIDEILGGFLRFDKYDSDSFNWWHCSRFKPLDDFEITTTNCEDCGKDDCQCGFGENISYHD